MKGRNEQKVLEIAVRFGQSLDNDDFETTHLQLSLDCEYVIGDEVLFGPENICKSYEDNMIAGRKKLDHLEWGQSSIEEIGSNEFFVHFTDYLTHQGVQYAHKCKQKLTVNQDGVIERIEHIHDQDELDRLNKFYVSVGLAKS